MEDPHCHLPSPDNPRSSATAVHSLGREVLNRRRRLVI